VRQQSKKVSFRLERISLKNVLEEGMQQSQLTTYADIAEVRTVTGEAACNQLLAEGWVLLGVFPLDNDERLLGRPNKPKRDWRDWLGVRGKTAWDWLALLIVPLFIVVATVVVTTVLNYFENQRENQRADALRKADTERADTLLEAENRRALAQQQIEDDRARGAVLQSYIQDMTKLLLEEQLATSGLNEPIRAIARSSTLTAIRQLDADRKGVLLQFLHESNLIRETNPIISLNGANLSNANLTGADLSCSYERASGSIPIRIPLDNAPPLCQPEWCRPEWYQSRWCQPELCRSERCQPERCQPDLSLPAQV
jgi:hypothetical protein